MPTQNACDGLMLNPNHGSTTMFATQLMPNPIAVPTHVSMNEPSFVWLIRPSSETPGCRAQRPGLAEEERRLPAAEGTRPGPSERRRNVHEESATTPMRARQG